jgi:hypothetical protein
MVEKALSLGLVAAVALWGGVIAFARAEVIKPPAPDCAVICFKTEPLQPPPFPEPVLEEPPHESIVIEHWVP